MAEVESVPDVREAEKTESSKVARNAAAPVTVQYAEVRAKSNLCESGVEKQMSNELIRWFCGN